MKIGILTLHRPSNFGANLQAYSSFRYFLSLGYDVKVVDYVRNKDVDYKNSVVEKQFAAHKLFVEQNLKLTRQISDTEGLINVVKEEHFDAIIIGADAVWRSPKDDCIYFAKWVFQTPELDHVKVASISPAHMGNGFHDVTEGTRQTIKKCLEKFAFITTRDEWTKNIINRDIFSNNNFIKHINPDPVVTLYRFVGTEKWQSCGIAPKSYIVMTLPVDWTRPSRFREKRIKWFSTFKKLVNNAGLSLVQLPTPEGKVDLPFDYTIDYPIDSIQWFLWIRNSKGFCGIRFHAVVSSISNGVPFYSMDSYGDHSRLSMVLDMLHLHFLARKKDYRSKIRNLLQTSGFEDCRTGRFLEFESPYHVFDLLVQSDASKILDFRNKLENTFDNNMDGLIKAISNTK